MGWLPTFLFSTSSFQSHITAALFQARAVDRLVTILLFGWNIYPRKTRILDTNHICDNLLKGQVLHNRKWRRPGTLAHTQSTMHKGGLPLWKKWVTVSAPSFGVGTEKIMPDFAFYKRSELMYKETTRKLSFKVQFNMGDF